MVQTVEPNPMPSDDHTLESQYYIYTFIEIEFIVVRGNRLFDVEPLADSKPIA